MLNNIASDRRIRGIIYAMTLVVIIVLISSICMPIYTYASSDNGIDLFVLMYHNVVPNNTKCSKYEIRAKDLESDFKLLRDRGLRVVTPSDIYAYQRGDITLPKRCVMITFDDGYYSYIAHVLPLLEKYDMRAVVNVVGEYTKYNKNNKATVPRYRYLDYEDIGVLRDSGRIEIGLHSYAMHHISNGVNGVGQRKGESDSDYRLRLIKDTNKLTTALSKIGIKSTIYAYPYGTYSRYSDRVLRECGVKMTLSCNERINHLTRTSSLSILGRYNRDGRLSSLDKLSNFFDSTSTNR